MVILAKYELLLITQNFKLRNHSKYQCHLRIQRVQEQSPWSLSGALEGSKNHNSAKLQKKKPKLFQKLKSNQPNSRVKTKYLEWEMCSFLLTKEQLKDLHITNAHKL